MNLKTKTGAEITERDFYATMAVMNDALYALASLPASARDATAWRDALMVAYVIRDAESHTSAGLRTALDAVSALQTCSDDLILQIINEIAPEPTP